MKSLIPIDRAFAVVIAIVFWPPLAGAQLRSTAQGGVWTETGPAGLAGGNAQGVAASYDEGGLILGFTGENLLADPGFEAPPERCPQMPDPYSQKPRTARGWEHNGLAGGEGAVRTAPFARSGARAWELVDTAKASEPALLQFVPLRPEYRGKPFVFSVWARTREGTNDLAVIGLKFRSRDHWRYDVAQPITVSSQWRQYSVTAVMPAEADELGVMIGPSSFEGQGAIVVDDAYLARASYASGGIYVSEPRDMGQNGTSLWRAAWRADVPNGTAVELAVRTGNTATPDGSWSTWTKVQRDREGVLKVAQGRYLQYQARLTTTRPDRTPLLRAVEFRFGAKLGLVSGTVTHRRTGAPIPGAVVGIAGVTTVSDLSGQYLLGVPAGPASGSVTALHYLPEQIREQTIHEGQRIQLDLKLQPDPSWPTFRGGSQRQGYSALSGSLDGFGVAWQYRLGTVGGGQILAADVDGDGRSELVVAQGGSLSARRLEGALLWQVDGWEIGSILGVYDLLGDGQKEVIGLSAGWQPYANGAFTVIRGRDGAVLSRVDTWPDAGDIGHGDTKDHLHGSFSPLDAASCVVADLDKDGKQEILVHPNYHSALMAFHFHDGLIAPKMMWKTQERFKYDLYLFPLLAADVDGDGFAEIVYHDHDLIRIFDGRTGRQKSAADMGCPNGLFGPMACGDVDGDGRAEVVLIPGYYPTQTRNTVALAGWNGQQMVRRWSRDFPQPISSPRFVEPLRSPLADVDGDRKLEIILQIGPDVVVLQGVDGSEKARISAASLVDVADLDRDGVAEIVVQQGGRQVVYNGKSGFGPKAISYPATWGWHDWGGGELMQLRGAANGQTEIVNQKGQVKATLPGAPYMTSPVVADLDGDGKMEVLVRDPTGVIRVLNATSGSPKPKAFPEWRCDLPGDLSRGGGITVCDLEGDGKKELIFRQDGHLVVVNSDGSLRFKSAQGGLQFPTVGRFDGDGVKGIACFFTEGYTTFRGQWTAYSGKDGKILWTAPAQDSNEVAVWDTNGDGRDEIAGKMGPVFLINGADGKTLWTAFRKEQCALGLGTFADLNGDGAMEILISGEYSNTAWYPSGKNMWWIGWSSGGAKEHYGAVADVNRDGAWDFCLSSNHGVLYCIDGRDGRELWTFKIPQKVSLSHCAAADLDGDGRVELVFGTNTGKLIIVRGSDGSLVKTIDLGSPVGEPIVADVNGDGLAEVLVVAGGTLHCLAARKPTSEEPKR